MKMKTNCRYSSFLATVVREMGKKYFLPVISLKDNSNRIIIICVRYVCVCQKQQSYIKNICRVNKMRQRRRRRRFRRGIDLSQ